MTKFVVVCLGILLLLSSSALTAIASDEELSPFTLANRVGGPTERAFFLFSTSTGEYVIRHDGYGESAVRGIRRVFTLRVGPKGRIDRLYFHEYRGDLLLLYEAGGSGYVVRLEQKRRKVKWVKPVDRDFEPPLVKGEELVFSDGTVVSLN